jgi:hypothetical protein
MRLLPRYVVSAGAAVVAALVSLSVATAESASDNAPAHDWDEVFAQVLPDQKRVFSARQLDWLDDSALAYAKSKSSRTPPAPWLAQPLPAVDGINAKIEGYGGGANHSNGFYGTTGSLSVPLAQQWGLQLDGGVAGSENGIRTYGGAGHLFWRDPSIGLLGAYGSYSRRNGTEFHALGTRSDGTLVDVNLGQISANTGRVAAEVEVYFSRWTFGGVAGAEMISINSTLLGSAVPNRFFDSVRAAYYPTDNFQAYIGHTYTGDTHVLTLGSEYGFALGGGRMASLFANGWIGEGGGNGARAGLPIYFGQHDKSLIDRHRQDDPPWQPTYTERDLLADQGGCAAARQQEKVCAALGETLGIVNFHKKGFYEVPWCVAKK